VIYFNEKIEKKIIEVWNFISWSYCESQAPLRWKRSFYQGLKKTNMDETCMNSGCGKVIYPWQAFCDGCQKEIDQTIEEMSQNKNDQMKTEEEAREGLCVFCQVNPSLPIEDNFLCQECNSLQEQSQQE
jgi:flavodoxin